MALSKGTIFGKRCWLFFVVFAKKADISKTKRALILKGKFPET